MNNISPDFEKHGGSYLLSDENYEKYVNGLNNIGRADGQFMIPSNQMDDLLKNHTDNPREWERQLGLNDNSLGDSIIHRVDVYNPQDYEPRFPTSELSGINDRFLEGRGKVPGGQDECVINQFPNPENNPDVGKISEVFNGQTQIGDHTFNLVKNNLSSSKMSYGGGARAPDKNTSNRDIDLQADLGLQGINSISNNSAITTSNSNGIV